MINLSEPFLTNNEIKNIIICFKKNSLATGNFIQRFEKKILEFTNSKYACSCINGTSALHLSLKVLGIKKHEEVIVPTLTFVATINAVIYNDASPIFMDADNYYNIDINKTIQFILNETFFKKGYSYNRKTNKKVFAVIVTHVWGNAVKLDELFLICKKNNIKIVEDATESLGTKYIAGKFINKHVGTIGDIGCLSFNGNKIITSAGGGMVITNNKIYSEKVKYYSNQCKNNNLRYIHNEVGFNYRLSNIQAAIGLAQLKNIKKIINLKNTIHNSYKRELLKISGINLVETPYHSYNNKWLNIIRIDKKNYKISINKLIKIFSKNNVQVRPIWMLNHKQKMFKKYQKYKISNANKLLSNSLCLPSSANLSKVQIKKIIKVFNDSRK